MTGYEVSPAELRSHATSFGTLVAQVHTASEAANTEGVMGGGNPYGLIFTPLIMPILATVCTAAQGFIAANAKLGDGIEKSLHDNVDVYTEVERAVGDLVKKVIM